MEKCYFKVPDAELRKQALGTLPGTPFRIKKSLEAILNRFEPIPAPKPSDWLWDHEQQGQSYDAYRGQMHNELDQKRNTIHILPLEKDIPLIFLQRLKKYCQAFFLGAKVEMMKAIDLNKLQVERRINEGTNKIQYHAGNILNVMQKKIMKNTFCMIGVTLSDLYPRDQWNFVFGLAKIKDRTGVFSFARYDQLFFTQNQYIPDYDQIFIRSVKVMVHQIGHMFGMRHCIYYNCIMNGSNHMEQNLRKPMQLCPVCLRKLQSNLKFDILERYKRVKQCLEIEKYDKLALETANTLNEIILSIQTQFLSLK